MRSNNDANTFQSDNRQMNHVCHYLSLCKGAEAVKNLKLLLIYVTRMTYVDDRNRLFDYPHDFLSTQLVVVAYRKNYHHIIMRG